MLVLALVFVVSVALVLLAVVTLGGTSLIETANLQNTRSIQYAADGAVDAAIQVVRYQNPVVACSPNTSFSAGTINPGISNVIVFCQVAAPSYERQVSFAACTTKSSTFAGCQSKAIVQAEVLYGDVKSGCPSGGLSGCTAIGQTATVLGWTVDLANG
jgi:hypothetical protein